MALGGGTFTVQNKILPGAYINFVSLAKEAGNIKAVNVVLIGVMAKSTDIPYENWVETIKTTVPEKFLDINLFALLARHSIVARHSLGIVTQKQGYQAPNHRKYNSTQKHQF